MSRWRSAPKRSAKRLTKGSELGPPPIPSGAPPDSERCRALSENGASASERCRAPFPRFRAVPGTAREHYIGHGELE